ncbi:MAG TPA: GNAT family N-acetyltransferase [Chryseosolibacter sp.]
MNATVKIQKYKSAYREQVIDVWEQSVRATHHFLEPSDIDFYKTLVEGIDFNSFDVYCVFDDTDGMIGIIGVADFKLEMLFLKPKSIGKGIGKALMNFILEDLKVTKVDVNEGNAKAVEFYQRAGFKVFDRTALDDHGKPYPILKMKLVSR